MAAGEAWLFDNWRLHRVENPTPDERIHLVADTSGSSSFWQFVAEGDVGGAPIRELRFDPSSNPTPLTERTTLAPVMTPAEVDLLVLDLRAELTATADTPEQRTRFMRYQSLLDSLCRDWRQLYALYGEGREGWPEFVKLRDSVRVTSRSLAEGLVMRTNRIDVHQVLEGRVLRPMLSLTESGTSAAKSGTTRPRDRLQRPLIIVAGSSLRQHAALRDAGESHRSSTRWAARLMPSSKVWPSCVQVRRRSPRIGLRLSTPHPPSSRTSKTKCSGSSEVRTASDRQRPDRIRRLEKTPKNALRIPFFEQIFPDARYIFLWRDPRENLSSIIEAWRSGRWKTYNGLPGFDGPGRSCCHRAGRRTTAVPSRKLQPSSGKAPIAS